jgi:hypothetical protein
MAQSKEPQISLHKEDTMPTTSVLSLGTRKDAGFWSDTSANALGYTATHKITKPIPSLQEIKNFFGASDDWLFLGGHFTHSSHLYNEESSVTIRFETDRVKIDHPEGSGITLKKGAGFNQHKKSKYYFGAVVTCIRIQVL